MDLLERIQNLETALQPKRKASPYATLDASHFIDNYLALAIPELRQGAETLESFIYRVKTWLGKALALELDERGVDICNKLIIDLPSLLQKCHDDCVATFEGDPAAHSIEIVALAYPGVKALAIYRLAHALWSYEARTIARILSETIHAITGIDIHPGATMGEHICIDHGTGIVIGETAIVGDRVKLYHGVTLGGLSVYKKQAGKKRHPTIEADCVLYAHATILGGETVVGAGSVVGGGVWLTKSIPPLSQVVLESTYKVLS